MISPEVIGVIGIVILVALFLLRMPVAFAMIFVGFTGFAYLTGFEPALKILAQDFYETLTSHPISVIPMFVLMGSFAFAADISTQLYRTTYTWVGQFRGGLTMATVFACTGFSAISGSTAATAATMGKIALPEMRKYKYDDSLATGTIAAAGTLGIMIPPSGGLILYGILVEESIAKLFVAGILPGIILSIFFVCVVAFLCLRNPQLGPAGDPTTWKEKIKSLTGIFEAVILFLLSVGGLFLGWFSPTQAGAIGAGGTLLIGLIRRKITWDRFINSAKDGLRTSCMILFIITSAMVFGHFMAMSGIPFMLADWVGGLPLPRMAIMGIIMLIFFMGGFFMDIAGILVVMIPIMFPVVTKLGYDPIWFGIICTLLGEMGVITPPVGINVFVIKGISEDIPLGTIFRGILPFLLAIILLTILITIFPGIATFLPSLVSV